MEIRLQAFPSGSSEKSPLEQTFIHAPMWLFLCNFFYFILSRSLLFFIITFISFFRPTINDCADNDNARWDGEKRGKHRLKILIYFLIFG